MRVCMYVRLYECTHVFMQAIYMYEFMQAYTCIQGYASVNLITYVKISTYLSVCAYVRIYAVYASIYRSCVKIANISAFLS
jgi:hypothetical protein